MHLHFHKITANEYRAKVAVHDGEKWVTGTYTVTSPDALKRRDPFHAWQAETPEGLFIADQHSLRDAMLACCGDVPSWLLHVKADATTVRYDPMLIAAVA